MKLSTSTRSERIDVLPGKIRLIGHFLQRPGRNWSVIDRFGRSSVISFLQSFRALCRIYPIKRLVSDGHCRAEFIMPSLNSYRVVAVSPDGQRLILDESLELDRAEQMRALLLQLKAYEEIQVEEDVADQTPRLTVDDGDNSETLALSD
jgi:hypothetical protein